jgi:hypothetical protein
MAEPARHDNSSGPAPRQGGKPAAPRKARGARGRTARAAAATPRPRAGTKAANEGSSRAGLSGQARLARLATEQGVNPITDPTVLLGDFWPEDEDADHFDATIRAWQEGRPEPTPP